MVEITIRLPDDLARDARELGILNETHIVELLQHEVDRSVMDIVNEEIQAYRAEKRQRKDKA